MIYMDHAATTALHPSAYKAMEPYLQEQYGNPSGSYTLSAQAKEAIEWARVQAARLIGARAEEIYFTSGGTEADNWALRGMLWQTAPKGRHLITSSIEHPAVGNTCRYLEQMGYEVTWLQPDTDGVIHLEQVRQAVRGDTVLVSIMMANNEVGTIEPIREIGRYLRNKNILFHTDAVQACGQIPVDVNDLMVDLLSASGHKFGGPKGTGFLYVRKELSIEPLIFGGGQERGGRSGTENVAGIVGLGEAARQAAGTLPYRMRNVQMLRNYMLHRLEREIPGLQLNGSRRRRLPCNLNISIKGADSREMIGAMDKAGICVSARSACSSGKLPGSHVLTALLVPEEYQNGTLRITLGSENTKEEADYVIKTILEFLKKKKIVSDKYSK